MRPTPEGARLYEQDSSVRAAHLSAILDEMGPDAAQEFIRGLRAYNDAYDRTVPRK